ncbi:MAG TPA: tetratricopeptide repeat protein, partial [Kofleriaceae bacterium]|nr:tetratricopeptide repeat protein [Kofleriaceae bacterium]
MSSRRAVSLTVLASLALSSGALSIARADAPSPAAISDAGKHFQRGVTLYNEADYRAALVEFRRAYEIAPNPAVLYNIGQTYFQLQNYAAALMALGRYLTEAGSSAAHRREVEQTIDTLQARVGKIAVTTSLPDCDITVDDEPVGKTPLADPVLVSIGRRKVSALRDGRVVETRFVDVAAGDTVNLNLSIGEAGARGVPLAPGPDDKPPANRAVRIGWITTGVLGAGAVSTGVVAWLASRDLSDARKSVTSREDLDSKSSRVSKFALAADILGA